jgi:hypothetical protein
MLTHLRGSTLEHDLEAGAGAEAERETGMAIGAGEEGQISMCGIKTCAVG